MPKVKKRVTPILLLILCSVLVVLSAINVSAAEPEGWQRAFGGNDDDGAIALVQTSDYGYALVGYTCSYGAGEDDFWLVKVDSSGNIQWNRTYGGTETDIASNLIETADGGYAIVGYTGSFGAGGDDFWLVKTDNFGNMQWNQTYGGAGSDIASYLIETSDGGYAIAGYTYADDAEKSDLLLIKTDERGVIPELSSWTIFLLILIVTLFVIVIKKRQFRSRSRE